MPVFKLDPSEIGSKIDHPLVVVMPVYNEEANIESVVTEWSAALVKIIPRFVFVVVNDGSRDQTQQILERLESVVPDRLVVVRKPNSGHGNSCRVGYDIAAASKCEWVLQIDSDGQCDPAYFKAFWDESAQADCIFGERRSRDDGVMRVLTSKICRWGASIVCGANLRDPNVPYRLMRQNVLKDALALIPPGFNIHNVALTYVLKKMNAIRWRHIPIHFRDRQGGSNSINLLNVSQWGVDMLLELRKLRTKLKKARHA